MEREDLSKVPDLAVIDVSFISLKSVLPSVKKLLKDKGEIISLVKPQFELGKKFKKKGIVKSKEAKEKALEKIKKYSKKLGLKVLETIESPIQGDKGNVEYFIHLRLE